MQRNGATKPWIVVGCALALGVGGCADLDCTPDHGGAAEGGDTSDDGFGLGDLRALRTDRALFAWRALRGGLAKRSDPA